MGGQILITNQDGKITIRCKDVDMQDMALMLGVLTGTLVTESVKRGMSVDTIKDAMLDIFLASTARLSDDTVENIIHQDTIF